MIKGVIDYNSSKIPFVINDYKLELFSESELVSQFAKNYNFKLNYVLTGQCFDRGNTPRSITVLVERSMGNTCYVTCFIVNKGVAGKKADSLCFESTMLDSVFRYKYNYLDLSRSGVNLAAEQREINSIPFNICGVPYELKYLIGLDHRLGLLTNFKRHGKTVIALHIADIEECYKLVLLLKRFLNFITSTTNITFERIKLTENEIYVADFYCKSVSDNISADMDVLFCEFPVMKYYPEIFDNLAQELGSKISKSIPLGHLADYSSMYTPQRFIEQISAFEYLFEKLEPKKAKDKKYYLKDELKFMFDAFPEILKGDRINSDEFSKSIKELRRTITHGYAYYYDFNSNTNVQFYIIKLADLIQRMSLKLIGFNDSEISEFRKVIIAW